MSSVRDFENAEGSFGRMTADLFAGVLSRVADMALVLDGDGVVRDLAFGTSDLGAAGIEPFLGQQLIDVVTSESRHKIAALLSGASPVGRWRHVNFPVDGGEDVPISFQAFGLGAGRTLLAGRDERQSAVVQRRFVEAGRELERAHARQRQADLRFQTMLALSDLAVLTLDGETLAVLDASPPAIERLGAIPAGTPFTALLAPEGAERARDALIRATGSGRIAEFRAVFRHAGETFVQAALFRHERASRLLVRVGEGAAASEPARDLVAAVPHGLVVTDARLRIELVNRAFVDQAQLSLDENALGQPLDRFLGRGGVDTGILVAALREEPLVRGFASLLTGAFGAASEIEVDAVRLPGDRYGFMIRSAVRDRRARALAVQDRAGLAERMTEVVGRVALKEIVRDTTDVIERLCVETALGLTDGNRAAAAEMLGISRQSLYAKLARYGIGGRDAETDADD